MSTGLQTIPLMEGLPVQSTLGGKTYRGTLIRHAHQWGLRVYCLDLLREKEPPNASGWILDLEHPLGRLYALQHLASTLNAELRLQGPNSASIHKGRRKLLTLLSIENILEALDKIQNPPS